MFFRPHLKHASNTSHQNVNLGKTMTCLFTEGSWKWGGHNQRIDTPQNEKQRRAPIESAREVRSRGRPARMRRARMGWGLGGVFPCAPRCAPRSGGCSRV